MTDPRQLAEDALRDDSPAHRERTRLLAREFLSALDREKALDERIIALLDMVAFERARAAAYEQALQRIETLAETERDADRACLQIARLAREALAAAEETKPDA